MKSYLPSLAVSLVALALPCSALELARYTLNDTDRLDPTLVDPLVTASAFQINGQSEDPDGGTLDDNTYQFTPTGLTINRGNEDFWKPVNLAAPFQFTITASSQDILVSSVTITAGSSSVHVTAARLGASTTLNEYGTAINFLAEGQTLEVSLPSPYLITAGNSRTFYIDLDSNAFESTHEFGTIIVNGTADVPLVINNFADGSDAATGISSANTYTHLIDINKDADTAVINGVTFDNTLGSYSLNGPAGTFATNPANGADPGSGMNVLLDNFRFGSTDPHVLTLSGLTPGATYKLRIYTGHWNGSNVTFSFDDTFPVTVVGGIDRGAGQVIPSSIDYTYTLAPGDTDLALTVTSPGSDTFHWYGFSNEVISGGPGSDFGDWIAGFPEVGAQDGLADDPDGDGIPNGVENFFGTEPDAFSQGLIAEGYDAGTGTFTFTHPQGTLANDLSASYRWSKDLVNFHGELETDGEGTIVEFTAQVDTPSPGTTTVTAEVTGTATSKLFVLVEVTQN